MTFGVALSLIMTAHAPAALAACADPVGNEGEFIYNQDYNIMQFCNGTDWVGMAGGSVGSGGASALTGLSDVTISSPSDGQVLKYNSGVWENAADGGSGAAGSDMQVQFNDGGTTLGGAAQLFWDKANNRLGVNTSAPAEALDVSGVISTDRVAFKMVTGAPAPNAGSGLWSSDGTNVWRSSGSIGVGASGPAATGHFKHSGTTSGTTFEVLRIETSNTAAGSGPIVRFRNAASSDTARITVLDSGDFGGHLTFNTKAADNNAGTASTERMRITAAGDVGVGTTSPSYKLDVNGTANATAFRSAAGQTFKMLSGVSTFSASGSSGGIGTQGVNFGYTFSSPPIVVVTGASWGAWCNLLIPTAYGTTTTGFQLGISNPNMGDPSGANCSWNWIAMGN